MNAAFDWISLLLGTAFALFWRYMDYRETLVGMALGTKETNPFVKDKYGKLSPWKAWVFCGIPIVAAWITFFAFDETEHWDRFWLGFMAAVGGVASMIAYFSNRRLHRKIRENGGIPSAGSGVPGGIV